MQRAKDLKAKQPEELLGALKACFEKNMNHPILLCRPGNGFVLVARPSGRA
jgi:hypothetical protein